MVHTTIRTLFHKPDSHVLKFFVEPCDPVQRQGKRKEEKRGGALKIIANLLLSTFQGSFFSRDHSKVGKRGD